VKRYSSGMYVRLAFAVAAHLEPDILVVDEVLSVGDAAFQEKCLGKMNGVAHEEGRTVLLVSHNMAAVQQLCGRALLVRGGCLEGEGDPAAMVKMYMADIPAAGKVSLRDRKDRNTNGDATIVDFETCDQNGNHAGVVMFGGSLRFRMTVEFHRWIGQPMFAVAIHSATGETVLDIRSSHAGLVLGRTGGRVTVECAVDGIGLYPGEYSITPWLFDNLNQVDLDEAAYCCTIRVAPAPGAHGDLNLNPNSGKYWIPSDWTVLEREEAPSQAFAAPLA
jgi:lipopolysaccharide transport system ATP-binding protein